MAVQLHESCSGNRWCFFEIVLQLLSIFEGQLMILNYAIDICHHIDTIWSMYAVGGIETFKEASCAHTLSVSLFVSDCDTLDSGEYLDIIYLFFVDVFCTCSM